MSGRGNNIHMYTYDYFIKQFQDAKLYSSNQIEAIDDELFSLSPQPGKWCIGEIVEHLNLTAEVYLPSIKKSIDSADDELKFGGEPFQLGFFMKKFYHYVSPEYSGKVPTNKNFQPAKVENLSRNEIQQKFSSIQDEFLHLVRKAQVEQIALDKVTMRNPIIKLLKMDTNAAFAIMEAHQRRHFSQIKDIILSHS